jgi:hypothetical protein
MERDREGSPPREDRPENSAADSRVDVTPHPLAEAQPHPRTTAAASCSTKGATARSERFSCLMGRGSSSDLIVLISDLLPSITPILCRSYWAFEHSGWVLADLLHVTCNIVIRYPARDFFYPNAESNTFSNNMYYVDEIRTRLNTSNTT